MKSIDIPPGFNFEILFYPSFILPLLNVSKTKVKKIWGFCSELSMEISGNKIILVHSNSECIDYAEEILGLWSTPLRIKPDISKEYREFVDMLIESYEWLGIATSSRDDLEIFTSIFLSKNTDFHVNVVKWVRNILEKYGCMEFLLHINEENVLKSIGRSYQIREFINVLRKYAEFRKILLFQNDISTIKRILLNIKGVGPKIVNAYMLFIKKHTYSAPVDRNLINFLKKFEATYNIISELPKKNLCVKYLCSSCPIKSRCTYYRFVENFKSLSGWIQTVAYLHNKMLCNKKFCDKCNLKNLCIEKNSSHIIR